MFVTKSNYRFNHPLASANENYWKLVHKTLNSSWLYSVVKYLNDAGNISDILLIPDVHLLEDILKNKGVVVKELYVVTPGYINKSKDWKMNRILYLGKALLKDGGTVVYKYVLSNGEVVHESIRDIDPKTLQFETIFEIKIS